MASYYAILDITEKATEEEIRKAYRTKAKLYHPDVNNSPDAQAKFILVKKAYEVLINRQLRYRYDLKNAPNNVHQDPFYHYNMWAHQQKVRQEEEARKKYQDYLRHKKDIQDSKMYYPYMITMYVLFIFLMASSVVVLVICAIMSLQYHLFMFFFLLPFISGAAFVLKYTWDLYKKYKALFN